MFPRLLAVITLCTLAVALGCINPGSRSNSSAKHVPSEQKGQVTMEQETEKDIFFSTAFIDTPDITLKDQWNLRILEKKPDHFRVSNTNYERVTFTWTAKGERVATPSEASGAKSTPDQPAK